MPSVPSHRIDSDGSSPFASRSESTPAVSDPLTTWIIVIAVIGILAGIMVAATVGFVYYKRKKSRKAHTREPLLEPWHGSGKRRTFNHTDEIQRRIMIRKSLASRSSHSSQSSIEVDLPLPNSPKTVPPSPRVVVEDEEEGQEGTLLSDWKRWEANTQSERAQSSERHPLELANPIAMPPKSQDRSASRSPLLRPQQPAVNLPPSP